MIQLQLDPDVRTLRQFGLAALVVFGALGFALWGREMPLLAGALWGVGGVSGALALVAPQGNRPLFVGLSVVALPIGLVVSYTLLLVIYGLLITPIGLLRRLREDPMRRAWDESASSYWVDHVPPSDAGRYFRQF